ncbi:homocysteine S-methyltransferase family protein, partial [Streptomyces sp. CHA15]|nr:homocysteine S-methyltransferase family protein [Streptomyces sp. CHA15]
AHTPLILDGALATELERKGCDLNDSLWSAKILIEQPELIQQVHLDYFQAGADCATTASYQTTIDGFAEKGYTKEDAIELMKRSVTLAKEACEQ